MHDAPGVGSIAEAVEAVAIELVHNQKKDRFVVENRIEQSMQTGSSVVQAAMMEWNTPESCVGFCANECEAAIVCFVCSPAYRWIIG